MGRELCPSILISFFNNVGSLESLADAFGRELQQINQACVKTIRILRKRLHALIDRYESSPVSLNEKRLLSIR